MPFKRPKVCKDCQATGVWISNRGLCEECAIARQTKAAIQLSTQDGPYYETWRERMKELMPSRADRF